MHGHPRVVIANCIGINFRYIVHHINIVALVRLNEPEDNPSMVIS